MNQLAIGAPAADAHNALLTVPRNSQTEEDVQAMVRILAALPESDAPVLSCYLDLESSWGRWESQLERRVKMLRQTTASSDLEYLDGAVEQVRNYLETQLLPGTRGVAIFSRVGRSPYFSGLQFEVPTKTWISLDSVPNIYHLIELRDTFDRYLVLFSTAESGRIFEVHLGSVTRELWLEQPELRRRVGREWTRLHYQNHRRDRERSFISEKIRALERLMMEEGYAHLVLAGDPQRLAMIRRELPRTIRERVVDIVTVAGQPAEKEVVEATLQSFIEEEERESQTLAQMLIRELRRDGLAVAGAANSLQVLRRGQADALIMARDWKPLTAWSCGVCTWSAAGPVRPEVCADCGSGALKEHDAREELVRLAGQTGCHIELVGDSPEMDELGGVGCLLRFAEWVTPAESLQ